MWRARKTVLSTRRRAGRLGISPFLSVSPVPSPSFPAPFYARKATPRKVTSCCHGLLRTLRSMLAFLPTRRVSVDSARRCTVETTTKSFGCLSLLSQDHATWSEPTWRRLLRSFCIPPLIDISTHDKVTRDRTFQLEKSRASRDVVSAANLWNLWNSSTATNTDRLFEAFGLPGRYS